MVGGRAVYLRISSRMGSGPSSASNENANGNANANANANPNGNANGNASGNGNAARLVAPGATGVAVSNVKKNNTANANAKNNTANAATTETEEPPTNEVKGGYRPTKKDRAALKRWKQGKSIGFTMRASLKAKGLIPRANGTRRVSNKYKKN